MGVLGLWQLIESAGRPVALETLEGKVLAVDASILLNQAIKGMKDKQGRTIANAHLAVLFHRVCKLLFYRIKPVFVFDGGAPELKRRTLMRRQQRRDQAAAVLVKASENALKSLLKQHALEEVAKVKESGSCVPPAALGSPAAGAVAGGGEKSPRARSFKASSCAPADMYELPPLPASTMSIADSSSDEDGEDNDPVNRYIGVEDVGKVDTESSEFLSLPMEMQHEILSEIKDIRKSKRRVNWQDLPKSSDDFAHYQMSKLVKHSKLTQKISDLRKAMKTRSAGLMLNSSSLPATGQVASCSSYNIDANRIASDDHSHYILLKNIRHDRSAAGEAESAPLSASWSPAVASAAAEPPFVSSSRGALTATDDDDCTPVRPGQSLSKPRPDWVHSSIAKVTVGQPGSMDAEVGLSSRAPGSAVPAGSAVGRSVLVSEPLLKPSGDSSVSSGGGDGSHSVTGSSRCLVTLNASEPGTVPADQQPSKRSSDDLPPVAWRHDGMEAVAAVLPPPPSAASRPADAVPSTGDGCGAGLLQPADVASTSVVTSALTAIGWCTHPARGESARSDSGYRTAAAAAAEPTPSAPLPAPTSAVDNDSSTVDGDSDDDDDASFVEVSTVTQEDGASRGSTSAGDFENDIREHLLAAAAAAKADVGGSDVAASSVLAPPPSPPAIVVADGDSDEASSEVEASFVSGEWSALLLSAAQASSKTSPADGFAEEDVHRMELALETERAKLVKEQRKQEATAITVTEQMVLEAQELLKLFGVPYIVSPSEAEAQCATLEALGLCHGIVTDDSDVWLFGGHVVYKNFFKQDKFVELYKASDIQNLFGLNRNKLIALALVSGSDYTDGIDGAGPVTAMEILSEFNASHRDGIACLKAFAEWWQLSKSSGITAETLPKRQRLLRLPLPPGFPEDLVTDAYMKPVVDSSNEAFTWASPELHLLRNFALERFGWQQSKTDDMILPVVQRLNQRQSQLRIDSFFTAHGHAHASDGSYLVEKFKSKRVKKAASVLLGNHAISALQSGTSTGGTAVPDTTIAGPNSKRLSHQMPQKRIQTATGKRKRQKKSKICADLVSDDFSDSGDDALMMAAMNAYDDGIDLERSANRNGSSDNSGTILISCSKNSTGSTCTNGKGKASSRGTTSTRQLNIGPIPVQNEGRSRSGCSSETKQKQCRSSGRRRTAAISAGRRVQACVDLSESSSDSE